MQNFYELFADAATRHATRVAIEVQHRDRLDRYTYARLREMAERTAAWLALIGIAPGERCAILSDNDAHWCAAYLGVLRLGAVAVPLDTAYKATQVETLLRDSGARVIFSSEKYLATVTKGRDAAGSDARIVLLHGEHPEAVSFAGMIGGRMPAPPLPACPARPEDPAVTLYTSGTTSDPKGVVLTHSNLLGERQGAFEVIHASEHDCILGVLPLFHALAQMANLLLPLSIGARVVFLETVNTTELLRALKERQVTLFACVPQFFYLIHQRVTAEVAKRGAIGRTAYRALLGLNRRLRSVGINLGRLLFSKVHAVVGRHMRVLVTGGSKFDPEIGRDLYAMGFDILQGYGLTETSGAATLMHPGDPHVETVGPPLPGVEIRIGPRDAGDDAPDGEVLIRGPVVMKEYFHRPEATAAALVDGWLHTGDLGRLDEGGRLRITGRRKELIVLSSGKNIYPEEIEAVYRKSSFIKELCVLGLTRPGEPSAERLYAVVVPDEDALRERKIANIGELMRFEMEGASVNLPHHKRVLGYEIWREPLPRTTTGKLKRFEIEKRVRSVAAAREAPGGPQISDADRAWLERPEVSPVLEIIRQAVRPGSTITPDANLELDLGLDSMERVELLTALEQRFGADVPEEEMQRLYTVRELSESILQHARAGMAATGSDAWETLLDESSLHETTLDEWLRPHVVVPTLLFAVLKLLMLLMRIGVRIETTGVDRLPRRGPYLISPNHQSYLDPFLLVGVLPRRIARQLFFVGASEYFETPVLRWLARQINLVPVDPDASLVSAMQAGAVGLRRGRVLILFPEGERSIDGTVRTFKKGAAILAHHVGVPVVPVAMDGLFAIWPRNRALAWKKLLPGSGTRVKLSIGTPIMPASLPSEAVDEEPYVRITRRLRDDVASLWSSLANRDTAVAGMDVPRSG
jgi:long-chain acyl-CoA synthetase